MKNKRTWTWRWTLAALLLAVGGVSTGRANGFAIQSFDGTGRLTYNTVNNGTDYNYRVEWAPTPGGPWSEFGAAGAFWLNARPQIAGTIVTNTVPMFYRVVATAGDYLAIDISGGPSAGQYPVTYYRTLADVPGSVNSDAYKTTNILMRLIPKGVYVMGSAPDELGRDSNETQHTVTLTKDFYIGVFPVTQKQWERVMGTRPSWFNQPGVRDSHPVEQVSYYDIREYQDNTDDPSVDWPNNSAVNAYSFMGKLRAKTGLATFDLPTESQWEYACRAGTTTALNSGKNLIEINSCPNLAEVGRYRNNGGTDNTGPVVVGSYLPNAWGLYDMHGNVAEWCLDWFGAYPGNVHDPVGATIQSSRVYRGGHELSFAGSCRSAARDYTWSSNGYHFVGFRIAMTLP